MTSTLSKEQAQQAASVMLPVDQQDYADYDPETDCWYIGVKDGVRELVVYPDGRLDIERTISGVRDEDEVEVGEPADSGENGIPVCIYLTAPKA